MSFNTKQEIIRALKENGIEVPTTIQEKAIPLIMSGKDVIGISMTGSGKTAAFVIPALDRITPDRHLQTIVVVPTRELAVQIAKEIVKFGKYIDCHVAVVFGGVSIGNQINELRKSNIVVGTPGRLLDHLDRRTIDLSKIKTVVLDEADKMVDMGFIDDIKQILNCTPSTRQTLLFGATISEEIEQLKHKYMKNPLVAKAEAHVKQEYLEQYYYDISYNEKFSLLVHLLKKEEITKALIFCSARSTVELVAKNLRMNGINADMIHGKMVQNKRLRVIDNFNKGNQKILVASSVAARGLHIDDVSHVINYDLAKDPQEYIHRIGRTARAGEKGKAITLLADRDHDAFRQIMHKYNVTIHKLPKEDFAKIAFQARQGFGGQRRQFGGSRFSHGGERRHFGERSHAGRNESRTGGQHFGRSQARRFNSSNPQSRFKSRD